MVGGHRHAYRVVTHGGAASPSRDREGTERAAARGMHVLRGGGSPLDAAVAACVSLEDDPRFNAGTGSNLRFDGRTIEMDAACMDSDGRFGGVAALRDVKNPVLVARDVLGTPHNLLAGEGALRYARARGHGPHDPWTERAQEKFDRLRGKLRDMSYDASECEWDLDDLARHWNFEEPLKAVLGPGDTVGAVASDGERFAAALSTGGTMSTLLGRVGDTPLPGCGLHAGPAGAVAVTGDGDHLARALLAYRAYGWLEGGLAPDEARDRGIALFPARVDVGIIIAARSGASGGSNRDMAWSSASEEGAG